jgi:hypothetical protein
MKWKENKRKDCQNQTAIQTIARHLIGKGVATNFITPMQMINFPTLSRHTHLQLFL